jgi:hypothetical protein
VVRLREKLAWFDPAAGTGLPEATAAGG